jgi:hypothetical protein
MKNLVLTAIFSALTVASLFAQKDQTLFHKVNITGGWGGAQIAMTNFNGETSALRGGFGGVEFNKNWFVGGGGYTSTSLDGIDQLGDTYEMNYGGLILGYGLKSHKIIHPQATILLGGGWEQELSTNRQDIFVVQPAAGVEINVLRWFRVGLHGGYRLVMEDQNLNTDPTFSGGYGSVSFKFGWSWGR